jgi:hypothetical protein
MQFWRWIWYALSKGSDTSHQCATKELNLTVHIRGDIRYVCGHLMIHSFSWRMSEVFSVLRRGIFHYRASRCSYSCFGIQQPTQGMRGGCGMCNNTHSCCENFPIQQIQNEISYLRTPQLTRGTGNEVYIWEVLDGIPSVGQWTFIVRGEANRVSRGVAFMSTALARLTLWKTKNKSLLSYFRGLVVFHTLDHSRANHIKCIANQLRPARRCYVCRERKPQLL